MSKYLKRLAARVAREALRESAKESKNWIVSKKLILETEEGDMEFDKGDVVEIGATPEGDMAMKGQAAVVVISDADLAAKIADIVVSSDELSDVNFVEKPALDAVLDGEEVDNVIDKLADDEDDNIEVAELDIEQKEAVPAKFEKFGNNPMNPNKMLACESIAIEESDDASINMAIIKADTVVKESFDVYSKFTKRVSELKGSIQPGTREVALTESGKVMGVFDKEVNLGELYTESSFDSVEEMDNFDSSPENLVQEVDLGETAADMDAVEESLKAFEESNKSGKDYMALVESLTGKKVGLSEAVVAKMVSTFNNKSLNEGCRVFDTKLGVNILALKESVDVDNFIEETGEAKRFTKRFFA